jgi:hypothetical protein
MQNYDRSLEDVGNVVFLEHVNTQIPDQQLATLFYATGLGLTRDPYLMTGVTNMWINVGRSQFHLPTGTPQVLPGLTALVMPNVEALLERLHAVKGPLAGTRFAFRECCDGVEATSPWGNRIRCFAAGERFGPMLLGMPYVEREVPAGSAAGIARFYRSVLGTAAEVVEDTEGVLARVSVGAGQQLLFRETDAPVPAYDGHHIAIYVADFSGPYRRLRERGLVSEDVEQHQYRFQDIVDPDSGRVLATLEHEVRSMRHPLYARPLVNRNPAQSNTRYAPGYEDQAWAMPYRPNEAGRHANPARKAP